jgi:hypothetical protein
MQYDDKYIRKIDHRLTVSEYILVKPTLLTQIFQKCPRESVSQACNLCAKRANWHARRTLRTRLPRQFPFAPFTSVVDPSNSANSKGREQRQRGIAAQKQKKRREEPKRCDSKLKATLNTGDK